MMERCCETCLYNLGGGYNNCKINLEAECAAGEYEAWKPMNEDKRKEDRNVPGRDESKGHGARV